MIGRYHITVTYPFGLWSMDNKVRKAAGKAEWTSGTGLGERVLDFDYPSKEMRDAAVMFLWSSGLPIRIHPYEDVDGD
jgi:hypothetical protein